MCEWELGMAGCHLLVKHYGSGVVLVKAGDVQHHLQGLKGEPVKAAVHEWFAA